MGKLKLENLFTAWGDLNEHNNGYLREGQKTTALQEKPTITLHDMYIVFCKRISRLEALAGLCEFT